MALLLTEQDVQELLGMEAMVEALDAAFRELGLGTAVNNPRSRVILPGAALHVLPAGFPGMGVIGFKAYSVCGTDARFVVQLYSTATGELLALVEGDWLGRVRTGAASGVATRYMARPDARTVAIVGSGRQARTQLAAVCAVRRISTALVWGRDPARLASFCQDMSAELGISVLPADTVRAAVEDADVVCTITRSSEPVLKGEWLKPGTHVNAAGSNWANKQEVDNAAVVAAAVIAADSVDQARLESGDLMVAAKAGVPVWERVVELADIVAGKIPGRRTAEEITLFESQGIGLEDIAAAKLVYEAAMSAGRGTRISLDGRVL